MKTLQQKTQQQRTALSNMMSGSKSILTPLIPDCSVLRTLTILKNIRNPLIFLRKMATYSCFWQIPSSEI